MAQEHDAAQSLGGVDPSQWIELQALVTSGSLKLYGALLMAIRFAYQKDWWGLRAGEAQREAAE